MGDEANAEAEAEAEAGAETETESETEAEAEAGSRLEVRSRVGQKALAARSHQGGEAGCSRASSWPGERGPAVLGRIGWLSGGVRILQGMMNFSTGSAGPAFSD